jgi:hypothetical protein
VCVAVVCVSQRVLAGVCAIIKGGQVRERVFETRMSVIYRYCCGWCRMTPPLALVDGINRE